MARTRSDADLAAVREVCVDVIAAEDDLECARSTYEVGESLCTSAARDRVEERELGRSWLRLTGQPEDQVHVSMGDEELAVRAVDHDGPYLRIGLDFAAKPVQLDDQCPGEEIDRRVVNRRKGDTPLDLKSGEFYNPRPWRTESSLISPFLDVRARIVASGSATATKEPHAICEAIRGPASFTRRLDDLVGGGPVELHAATYFPDAAACRWLDAAARRERRWRCRSSPRRH